MNNKNILITLMVLVMVMTGCMKDDFGGSYPNELSSNTSTVITLTTDRVNGLVSLSIDAPENKRSGLWIDLDGDGIRATDGSEDIIVSNSYQDYKLAPGLRTVSLYGNITYLGVASNELTAIDVSGNLFLKTLNAPLNKLNELDISKNSALKHLDCSGNNISKLDVSHNTALVSLWSFNNLLLELNLTNNPELVSLDCSGNRLNTLDVSINRELIRLVCYNNQLTSFDISNNNKLNRLWLFGNSISDREAKRISDVVKEIGNVDLLITDFDNM